MVHSVNGWMNGNYTEFQLSSTSVQCSSTVRGPTETRNLLVFNGELVVISDLLPHRDISLGVNNDLLSSAEVDHFSIAVGLQEKRRGGG